MFLCRSPRSSSAASKSTLAEVTAREFAEEDMLEAEDDDDVLILLPSGVEVDQAGVDDEEEEEREAGVDDDVEEELILHSTAGKKATKMAGKIERRRKETFLYCPQIGKGEKSWEKSWRWKEGEGGYPISNPL